MTAEEIIFYTLASTACLSALGVFISRNIMYAAFLLLMTLICAAALFVFSGAEFVALAQIMVYVGGVLVLMVFGVMNTAKKDGQNMRSYGRQSLTAFGASGALGVLVFHAIHQTGFYRLAWIKEAASLPAVSSQDALKQIGVNLLTAQLLPFELVAILLLVALIGVAQITGKELRQLRRKKS